MTTYCSFGLEYMRIELGASIFMVDSILVSYDVEGMILMWLGGFIHAACNSRTK